MSEIEAHVVRLSHDRGLVQRLNDVLFDQEDATWHDVDTLPDQLSTIVETFLMNSQQGSTR